MAVFCKSASMHFVSDIALTTGYFLSNPEIRSMLEINCISLDISTICIFIRYSVFVFSFYIICFDEKNKKEEKHQKMCTLIN